jgi:hypothetical protein
MAITPLRLRSRHRLFGAREDRVFLIRIFSPRSLSLSADEQQCCRQQNCFHSLISNVPRQTNAPRPDAVPRIVLANRPPQQPIVREWIGRLRLACSGSEPIAGGAGLHKDGIAHVLPAARAF